MGERQVVRGVHLPRNRELPPTFVDRRGPSAAIRSALPGLRVGRPRAAVGEGQGCGGGRRGRRHVHLQGVVR